MRKKLLKALRCENRESPPVWIMRQAGRYLPAYQLLRKKYPLNELFHQPELAAEITQLPLALFDLDAAILFSDILVIAELFGLKVHFPEGKSPFIEPILENEQDIQALSIRPAEEVLSYVFKTIQLLQGKLSVPLLGFSGAPFTVATYLLQGEARTKEWIYHHPQTFHLLLQKLTEATITYLKLQIQAGVAAVQIFDSWANLLTYSHFMEFSAPYLKQIVTALKSDSVPVILFCRGSSSLPLELSALEPHAISFDWQKELSQIRSQVPTHIAVQGNFDPHLLKAPIPVITQTVTKLLNSMQGDPGFIVNLGHGILPDTPVDHVKAFVDLIHNHHLTRGGSEQRIASGFPPERKPNCVPRS